MLPIYEMKITENVDDNFEVNAVAGVNMPATQSDFFAFSEQLQPLHFAEINKEERIAIGAAMIPNLLIYRKQEEKEFNVYYTKETIEAIAVKFFEKGYQKNFNIMHDPKQQKDGVVFFQSFIKDTAKGIEGMKGDYPEGTWFLGAKINNDEVWENIKAGLIKGWSVEGFFKLKESEPSAEEVLTEMKKILNID